MTRGNRNAFTLIEVLVALAISASAMILLILGNNGSMKSSASSQSVERVGRFLHSKISQIAVGEEGVKDGVIDGCVGWRWRSFIESVELKDLKGLKKLRVVAVSDTKSLEVSLLIFQAHSEKVY